MLNLQIKVLTEGTCMEMRGADVSAMGIVGETEDCFNLALRLVEIGARLEGQPFEYIIGVKLLNSAASIESRKMDIPNGQP